MKLPRIPKIGLVHLLIFLALNLNFIGHSQSFTNLPSEAELKKLQADYAAALGDATNSIPCAKDLNRLFPGTRNYFSYYTGTVGPSQLVMERLLFDRYHLMMRMPVTFEADRRKIKTFGQPEFLMLEYTKVTKKSNEEGAPLILDGNSSGQLRLGASEWEKIVAAHGDFSVIGYKV